MITFLKSDKSEESQKLATFTGEGAYHGSTKVKQEKAPNLLFDEVVEALPIFLIEYLQGEYHSPANFVSAFIDHFQIDINNFQALFTNKCEVRRMLPIPSQDEIKNDGTTFCWCPIETAIKEAGPLTKSVLIAMREQLTGKKKFTYIDSKIQFFKTGDLPVDSKLWHVDGTIAIRDVRSQKLGHTTLHDMKARLTGPAVPPQYLAYQSSDHCATQFAIKPVTVTLPDCIPNFDLLDQLVKDAKPVYQSQPQASIVSFDGFSLHRAVPATADGWRLWIRCVETNREVKLDSSIINCYGTVFRP